MTGEDLFCCPSITGQVMSIKSPFHVLMNGLVKASSSFWCRTEDLFDNLSVRWKGDYGFFFTRWFHASDNYILTGFWSKGCFRGSFRYGRILKVYIMREVLNPVTSVPPLTALDEPWPFFHFWRHHFWPKIGIIDTQLLQGEKNFPKMPRSEWSAQGSLRYAQKCSKSWAKNSDQNLLPVHLAAPW